MFTRMLSTNMYAAGVKGGSWWWRDWKSGIYFITQSSERTRKLQSVVLSSMRQLMMNMTYRSMSVNILCQGQHFNLISYQTYSIPNTKGHSYGWCWEDVPLDQSWRKRPGSSKISMEGSKINHYRYIYIYYLQYYYYYYYYYYYFSGYSKPCLRSNPAPQPKWIVLIEMKCF